MSETELWSTRSELIETVLMLCEEVRAVVRPGLGKSASKGLEGTGASGDATFAIDEVAEARVEELLDGRDDIAYYTEDRGLIAPGNARYLLVIDPIDGTRPAAAGLESCCVSVACAPYRPDHSSLTLGDVFLGVVSEIKNSAVFTAVKGAGSRIEIDGELFEPRPSDKASISNLFWTAGYRGRPAEALTAVLADLIDSSSVDGGYFDLGSATFSMTRVAKGEMDAYVDVGQRMADEVKQVRKMFLEIGHGAILNNYPYDVAAAAVIASECGAVVTDAYGRTLDSYPLIATGGGGQVSTLVCSNAELHAAVLKQLDIGMERLQARYGAATGDC